MTMSSDEPGDGRYVLALDGALGVFSVALVPNVFGAAPLRSGSTPGASALEDGLALVARVLGDAPASSLASIAVGTGPGRFTGLRIAVAYAKSLALAWSIPLVGVSSYDALETAAGAEDENIVLALVEGRPGLLCGRLRTGERVAAPCCGADAVVAAAVATHLDALGITEIAAVGAAGGTAAALGELGIIVRALNSVPTAAAAAVARRATARETAACAHALVPDYGAEPNYVVRATAS